MTGFFSYYVGILCRPLRSVETLCADARRVRFGFYAMLVPVVGYTIVYVGLAESGAYPSAFAPFLALPAETYYRYNRFLLAPSILAAWILAAGVVQIVGRLVSARGSFEDTLSALGFAISIASFSLLPHDLTVALLGAAHIIDGRAHEHAMNAPTLARNLLWFFMLVYLVAYPLYLARALRGAHRVSAGAGWLLGITGFVVYQAVFVIFNR
jgi:hypothetical protein